MPKYSDLVTNNRNPVPQTKPLDGTQVKNNAGGYTWSVDQWMQLERFLILGSSGGTYYTKAAKLTADNAKAVTNCLNTDGRRTVDVIVDISTAGRASSNDPALFALAMAASHSSREVRVYALSKLSQVARTGTHLYHFADFVDSMRGWGRGLRNAIQAWFLNKNPDALAYQLTKYQQRDGWSARDLLRLSHPNPTDPQLKDLFQYVTKGSIGDNIPSIVHGVELMKGASTVKEVVKLIEEYRLDREMIPTKWLNETTVWEALLAKGMPLEAMTRNLAKMTTLGMTNDPTVRKTIVGALSNQDLITKSRLHPMKLLVAQKVYSQGRGTLGSLTWTPNRNILDALNDAFYLAFGNVQSTGKEMLLGLDVSGSMSAPIGGYYSGANNIPLTCAEGAAAMALITKAVEPNATIMGFSSKFVDLNISPKMTLEQVLNITRRMNFGSTDCSLPMMWAMQNNVPVEAFSVYTDNETYAGVSHPATELRNVRKKFNNEARLAVVGMATNNFTIADPNDAGMMDFVGFDTNTPRVMSEFFSGNI